MCTYIPTQRRWKSLYSSGADMCVHAASGSLRTTVDSLGNIHSD